MSDTELVAPFNVVTVRDVEMRLARPLTSMETEYAAGLLGAAARAITRAANSASVPVNELEAATVADVQAEMVARVFRNPEGLRGESDGQYSYSMDTSLASGRLELTETDKDMLGLAAPAWGVWTPQYGEAK